MRLQLLRKSDKSDLRCSNLRRKVLRNKEEAHSGLPRLWQIAGRQWSAILARLMRETYLSFSPPLIGEEEIAEVAESLRSAWLTTGPRVHAFEERFAEFVGVDDAVALNSGTSALHVALASLGIGPGDDVITTTMTFASSVHVIEHVGARPVLVDVESDTLNIDPDRIRAAIGQRTRAILPVHLYGHPCEMDPIIELADRHGLALVEDAAHALPATYQGKTVGRPTDRVVNLAAFSFYATKNLTTGEGGMLTGPQNLLDTARKWSLHGMSRDAYSRYDEGGSWRYDVVLPGFKYNMPDVQGAIGLVQLRKLPTFQARRREIVDRYNRAFESIEEVEIPTERTHVESALHIYLLRLNIEMLSIDRAQFIRELAARRIGSSVHFIPIHYHSYYRAKYEYVAGSFPVAEREFERIISIPLNPTLTDEDVDDVIDAVAEIVASNRS
jgi:dTDP-4-amino-4,6-dideoxygalactose transaminase